MDSDNRFVYLSAVALGLFILAGHIETNHKIEDLKARQEVQKMRSNISEKLLESLYNKVYYGKEKAFAPK